MQFLYSCITLLSFRLVFGELPDLYTYLSNVLEVPIDKVDSVAKNFTPSTTQVSTSYVEFLYYKPDSDNPIAITADNALNYLNDSTNTTFIIHGWTDNGSLPWIIKMASLLNQYAAPINVIAVDWRELASKDYIMAASGNQGVANQIGDFIISVGFTLSKLHVIGHSMGAQIMGMLSNAIGGGIGWMTGLDPAGPLYEIPFAAIGQWRLTPDDAQFVDVIHTALIFRGVVLPCGTIDFYVNNGFVQPDCLSFVVSDPDTAISCSHQFAHTYYSLTIINKTAYPASFIKRPVYMGFGVNRTIGIYNIAAKPTGINYLDM